MANSILKKGKKGYGYNYTEMAQINSYLAEMGLSYYQYIERIEGDDYIWTVKVDEDGNESKAIMGCKIITGAMVDKQGKPTANKAQDYGAALTYARRYSLLLAYGLSTTDTDGLTDSEIEAKKAKHTSRSQKPAEAPKQPDTAKKTEKAREYSYNDIEALKSELSALVVDDAAEELLKKIMDHFKVEGIATMNGTQLEKAIERLKKGNE